MRASRIPAAALVAVAFAIGLGACGDDEPDASRQSTAAREGEAQRLRAQQRAATTGSDGRAAQRGDQGGAQLEAGPGSAQAARAVGAVATAGINVDATGGVRPFAPESPWNTDITNAAVDPRSAEWVRLVNRRIGIEETADAPPRLRAIDNQAGIYVNTRKWTVPVVSEEGGQETRVVCRQLPPYCGDGSDVSTLTIPADAEPLPEYDGWFTVYNRSEGVAYDLWRARRGAAGGVISYSFMRRWDLNGPGFQEPNSVSARGSGLPLFAGLIQPEEIAACRIEHALAIALPGPAQRVYVQPASATDGNGELQSMPEGARLRLKAGVRLARLPDRTNGCAARAIAEALRRYGAIVVDRAKVPTLFARLNHDWTQPLRNSEGRLLDGRTLRPLPAALSRGPRSMTAPQMRGNEVEQIDVEDFEVVRVQGPTLRFSEAGAQRDADATPAPPAAVTSPTTTSPGTGQP